MQPSEANERPLSGAQVLEKELEILEEMTISLLSQAEEKLKAFVIQEPIDEKNCEALKKDYSPYFQMQLNRVIYLQDRTRAIRRLLDMVDI